MKLKSVEIENYRAIEHLSLTLDPSLTVLHGDNGYGKTSVLSAIAVGLGDEGLLGPFLDTFIDFCEEDWREDAGEPRVLLTTTDGKTGNRQGTFEQKEREHRRSIDRYDLEKALVEDSRVEKKDMPIGVLYGTERRAISESARIGGVSAQITAPNSSVRCAERGTFCSYGL